MLKVEEKPSRLNNKKQRWLNQCEGRVTVKFQDEKLESMDGSIALDSVRCGDNYYQMFFDARDLKKFEKADDDSYAELRGECIVMFKLLENDKN